MKIDYNQIQIVGNSVILRDHLNGFNSNMECNVLYDLNKNYCKDVLVEYIFDNSVKAKYNNLNLKFDLKTWTRCNYINSFVEYIHPEIDYKNFICSFNGTGHVSRQLLSAILNNQGYFNKDYSSKNFAHDNDWITSHLDTLDLTNDEIQLYRKFFVNSDEFNDTVYSFGHVRFDHKNNIYNLEDKLTQSFVHIVSETMATSYYPFVTEKFLYSIVTRGLFLAYAQPEWHKYLEKYYGFKLYDTIFDYSFDEIQNPVKRLVKLIEMVSKFSTLSTDDWRDLYHMEQENIEYNYDHYFSGNYLKLLAQYE